MVCPRPDRVLPVHGIIHRELWRRARIRVHSGKTHVWNMAGVRPEGCDVLERLAQQEDLEARVWTGSQVPDAEQDILISGTKAMEHDVLFSNPQRGRCAIGVLLHGASARANYLLRVVRPDHGLQKPTRGIRGIVAGDIIRRLVGRTMGQQLGPVVERATSTCHCALRTRALLFSLRHRRASQAVAQLQVGEKLFAFLDDICVVCPLRKCPTRACHHSP